MAETAAYAHPSIDLEAWQQAEHDPAVLICDGPDIKITVRAGHLSITDGPPRQPRTRKIPRLPRQYHRLLILAGHGMITAEAIRWLSWAGLAWSMLDVTEGDMIASSGPRREDARLLRAQALAAHTDAGLAITRTLLGAKLGGQSAVLRDVLRVPGAAQMISEYADELAKTDELDMCRYWEAQAAITYWSAWTDRVTVAWSPHDLTVVPSRWWTFSGRTSMVNDGYQKNNHADGPVNALLNYMYRIAETEAVHACHALGLHPALGILHADKPGRDSMALDLMETIRPACDKIVLGMMDVGLGVPYDATGKPAYLDRRWLTETREGQCRLVPPLTHQLAGHAACLGSLIRPHAERVAKLLAGAAIGDVRLPMAKVKAATRPAPVSSKMPARLRSGVTVTDLVPDLIWTVVHDMIPAPPKRRKGAPITTDDRDVVAALAAHELLRVPWQYVPVSVSRGSCRGRLLQWQWSESGGVSAWNAIAGELASAGHLSALLACSPAT